MPLTTPPPNSRFFWPIPGVIALYLVVFFALPSEQGVPRGAFFTFLLLPDEYFAAWTGSAGTIALWDRLPILGYTLLCLVAAFGCGVILLLPLVRNTRILRFSPLELILFLTVAGLGALSALYFWYCWSGFVGFGFSDTLISCFFAPVGLLGLFCVGGMARAQKTVPPARLSVAPKAGIAVFSIFTLLVVLGGMVPSTDYDVLSYHLTAAREIAQSGHLGFQPHNVYANMPFGAEMFVVWGIALTGNAFTGAMVGKTLIALTTPLTALGLYAFGRRFFRGVPVKSKNVGLIAMVLYMTTPWILYVSSVGLIDSVVGMYAFFAIYAAMLSSKRAVFLAGFFAGCAAACKYPAMLFVVLPLLVFVLLRKKYKFYVAAFFLLGVFLACGGWYIKNWYYTGNPVYPLCYSIFGDSTGTWTPEVDARWTRIHSPPDFSPITLGVDLFRVLLTSSWNSPLIVPFLFLAVRLILQRNGLNHEGTKDTKKYGKVAEANKKHGSEKNNNSIFSLFFLILRDLRAFVVHFYCDAVLKGGRTARLKVLFYWILFVLACWWLLTHRIDRFWIPIFPVLSLIAAVGATRLDRRVLIGLLGIGCVYGFLLGGAAAPGKLNHYLAPLNAIRKDPAVTSPWSVWFNANPPEDGRKILLVGEAKAFLYDVPIEYATCFNAISLDDLERRNIGYVLVDWSEIARFRSPGNYGFPDNVQPELFDRLVITGILQRYCPTEELAKTSTIVYRVTASHRASHVHGSPHFSVITSSPASPFFTMYGVTVPPTRTE